MLFNELYHLRVILEMNTVIRIFNHLQLRPWNSRSNVLGLFGWANPIVLTNNNQCFCSDQSKFICVIKILFLFGIKIVFG